jgi:DNA-binding response OmpR family regulator
MLDMLQCLIIASDGEDRQQLARLLRPYGFELALVEDGEQALSVCRTCVPDLVVIAETLGGAKSYDLIRQIVETADGRRPKVLAYSDKPQAELIGRAIWSGASECFVKPFDAPIIDLKLRQVGAVQPRS